MRSGQEKEIDVTKQEGYGINAHPMKRTSSLHDQDARSFGGEGMRG
jgi:hypothetical protein